MELNSRPRFEPALEAPSRAASATPEPAYAPQPPAPPDGPQPPPGGDALGRDSHALTAGGDVVGDTGPWRAEGVLAEVLQGPPMNFDALDGNADGVLSGSELAGLAAESRKAYDADGTGEVSRAEFMAGREVDGAFAGDRNRDGYLSGDEIAPALRPHAYKAADGREILTRDRLMAAKLAEHSPKPPTPAPGAAEREAIAQLQALAAKQGGQVAQADLARLAPGPGRAALEADFNALKFVNDDGGQWSHLTSQDLAAVAARLAAGETLAGIAAGQVARVAGAVGDLDGSGAADRGDVDRYLARKLAESQRRPAPGGPTPAYQPPGEPGEREDPSILERPCGPGGCRTGWALGRRARFRRRF